MNLTLILAIWGSVLSTILAILELFKFRRDRAIINVRVRGDYVFIPKDHPGNPYGDKSLISISVSNSGRRPVTLKKAGLLLPRGTAKSKYLVPFGSVKTIELGEGKSHDYDFLEEEAKKYGLLPNKYVAFALDATGKCYWSHNILKKFYKLKRIK